MINGKNFHGKEIDSDIKRFEETTTGQDEDCNTRCLLNIII